ncbi:peptidoglycan DD-metalloendopeptidase family protein [Candidatus Binatia bacterium]|nr:peptidoglycan DD-metalloendopeptidase family protein [Candidatus Binatia bacterium]
MPPVAIKNKNYLNVKNGDDPWMDVGGKPSKTDPKGHAVFSDPVYGIRAGLLLLRTYFLKHDRRTILAILSRWAPATDTIGSQPGNPHNEPSQYALFVAQRMGISQTQKLALFRDDKTVDDLGQLRALFAAMAAYEVGGGFVVPVAELDAGLELVEPGITKHGTGPSALLATTADAKAKGWTISGSVGRADKGARNAAADVETVQSMLRSAAMILGDARFDPGSIDGSVAAKPGKSDTVRAIVAFQGRFLAKPDGLIEVGGRTWRELVAVVDGTALPSAAASGKEEESFPLAFVPTADWTKGARAFGADRSGNRAHAACDLYAPEGTVIHAVADGTVVRGPVEFYAKTFALEVDHGKFLARYGEIRGDTFVREGDGVRAGQPIARVGHLQGIAVASDMLHLELYDKSAHGPLTVPAAAGAIAPSGRPFLRRKDLIDPTPYLSRWKSRLPGAAVAAAAVASTTAVTAPAAAATIPSKGFCVHIRRVREEQRAGVKYARTIAEYQCYWNGAPLLDLDGQMAERGGPGDNTANGVDRHLRIAAGRYPLSVHDGTNYKTYGYAASGKPLPGLLLLDTGKRTWILIHPAHHAPGYVSSIGCINPATGLKDADSRINLADSRSRVIAIIEAMKTKMGTAFPKSGPIPDAVVVIEGEPAMA